MSNHHGPQFDVSVEHAGTTAIVRLAGELDLATAPELTEVLHGLESSCERVILDLTALEFIDSTGLRLAVTEHGRATNDGFEFVIAGAAGAVLKVLRHRPGREAPAGARRRLGPRRRQQERQGAREPLTFGSARELTSTRPVPPRRHR